MIIPGGYFADAGFLSLGGVVFARQSAAYHARTYVRVSVQVSAGLASCDVTIPGERAARTARFPFGERTFPRTHFVGKHDASTAPARPVPATASIRLAASN